MAEGKKEENSGGGQESGGEGKWSIILTGDRAVRAVAVGNGAKKTLQVLVRCRGNVELSSCRPSGDDDCDAVAVGQRRKLRASVLVWLVQFSLVGFLVIVAAAFFQAQLTSLREELAALKVDLSSRTGCGEKSKFLRKRSSGQNENRAQQESDVQAAHLEGSVPFQHIQKQGKIGPWLLSSTDSSFARLRGKSTELEISDSGTYYIYAQVYYLTSQPHNSYQILSHNGTEERKNHRIVGTCSSQGRNSVGEVSCHTGLIAGMRAGQRLYLNQVEQDRIIQFSNGCSYLGVVLLNRNADLKRKK